MAEATKATKRARPRAKVKRPAPSRPAGRARKISITVDDAVLSEARRVARATGNTLSAHITEALARDQRRRRLQLLIGEYEREHGVITTGELAEIRDAWKD
jgi:hypothetical protein